MPVTSSVPTGGGLNATNELLGQLSRVLQQLTLAIQGSTSLPYNPVPIGNANLEADDPSDALSELSIQQQQNDTAACATSPTSVTRAISGAITTSTVSHTPQLRTVSLPSVTPWIRLSLVSLSILLHYYQMSCFQVALGRKHRSLSQITPVGNDLSVNPQPSAKKIHFLHHGWRHGIHI